MVSFDIYRLLLQKVKVVEICYIACAWLDVNYFHTE